MLSRPESSATGVNAATIIVMTIFIRSVTILILVCWRASEASETLLVVVQWKTRYVYTYVYIYIRESSINVKYLRIPII